MPVVNPLAQDPSRTATLRRAAVAETRRRFARVRAAVAQVVGTDDALGLQGRPPEALVSNAAPTPYSWKFLTATEKVDQFRNWLNTQTRNEVLAAPPGKRDVWLAGYVQSAYQKGVVRSFTENAKYAPQMAEQVDTGFFKGSRAEFLRESFTGRVGVGSLQLIASRAYNQLQGITNDMDAKLTTILTNGLAHGINPLELAREMTREIDGLTKRRAETLARTEIINAQANGQLDSYEQLGIQQITALVEFSNTGDKRVCPRCQSLGKNVFTIEEARGIIPVHPNCRCAWKAAHANYLRPGVQLSPAARKVADRIQAKRKRDIEAQAAGTYDP